MKIKDEANRKMVESLLEGFVEERIEVLPLEENQIRKPNGYFSKMSSKEVMEYFSRNHRGKTLSQIALQDGAAYQLILERGLVDALIIERVIASRKRPMGYWKSIDNAVTEAKNLMKTCNLKDLPSQSKLHALGYSALATAIDEYHGGFHEFRRILGGRRLRNKHHTWEDLDFTLSEVKKIMREHRLAEVPSSGWLKENGYSSVGAAISIYHGGFRKMRTLMGQEQRIVQSGFRKDKKKIIAEAKKIMRTEGLELFPAEKELRRLGYNWIMGPISKYFGGMRKFRETLGEKQREREKGAWKDLTYALQQAKQFMDANGFSELPSQDTLSRMHFSSLANIANKYHGGLKAFREKLRQYITGATTQYETERLLGEWVNE